MADVKSILDVSTKKIIVRASFFVARSDGEIHQLEKDVVSDIAVGLSRDADEIREIIDDDIRAAIIGNP